MTQPRTERELPPRYAVQNVELAYASTAYGTQGETTRTAHLALTEHTGAASAYVAMTRGREANTAHLAPVSRRRPEPIPTFSRPPGTGPGIGF